MSLTGAKLYYAKFFNENNEHIKNKWFSKNKDKFKWDKGEYNHKPSDSAFFESKGILWDKRYYLYRKDCPEPISFSNLNKYEVVGKSKKKSKKKDKLKRVPNVILSPKEYHTLLESEHLKKLNTPSKNGIWDYLEPKHIVIGIGAILGIIYAVQSGMFS